MHYPLSTLHTLIHLHLHPRRLLMHPEQCNPEHKTWRAVRKEAVNLRLSFMQQAAGVKDTAALTVLVQFCTAGAVSLADRLSCYEAAVSRQPHLYSPVARVSNLYAALEQQLLRFIQHLRRSFPACFNKEQALPLRYSRRQQHRLAAGITALQSALQTAGAEDRFITVALAPFLQYTQGTTSQALTYGRLHYLRHLLQELKDCLHQQECNTVPEAAITACLIQNNCNHPAFVQEVFTGWQQQASEMSLAEAAEYWATRLRHCTLMLHYANEGLHPALPTVKEWLLSAIRQEIRHSATGASGQAAPPQQATEPLVTTSLSVTQLAVMLRVLVHCGILKCSNQSALFRQLAGAVRTEKAAKLSAESLRIKYHTPERTAISIVKDCLLQMISSLHKL